MTLQPTRRWTSAAPNTQAKAPASPVTWFPAWQDLDPRPPSRPAATQSNAPTASAASAWPQAPKSKRSDAPGIVRYQPEPTVATPSLTLPPATAEADRTPGAAVVTQPTPSAPALRLGPDVLQRAITDSRATVQTMAQQAQAETHTPILSAEERLARGVQSAQRPDCLGPQTGGGGLLAVPALLWQAASGKCRP